MTHQKPVPYLIELALIFLFSAFTHEKLLRILSQSVSRFASAVMVNLAVGSEQNPSDRNAVMESCTETQHKIIWKKMKSEILFYQMIHNSTTYIVHNCTIISFVIYFSSWAGLDSYTKTSEKHEPCPGCPSSF